MRTLTIFLIGTLFACTSLFAQNNNNNNRNSNSNSSNNSGDYSTTYSGVMLTPKGVLLRNTSLDYGRVTQQYLTASQRSYNTLPKDVQKKTALRYVSLNRLEKAIVDGSGVITEEMKYLAGLQRIQYVFYFPETKDIVIAGPAEGWFPGFEGTMMGATSHRPVCELQDLTVALRTYAPGKEGASVVGCSIDPTAEGNARLQEFQKQFGQQDARRPRVRATFVNGLRQALGMQTVRVDGISANTHAAGVMVAADYRMKCIGIGVEQAPVNIETFIANAKPGGSNALYRWYFVPDYQSVITTSDKTGIELVGNGIKLVAEDEVVAATGERIVQKGKVDKASRAFSQSFTSQYPKLAEKSLVFAQLRNFVDMLVCAAHIQKEDLYEKGGWSMEFLGSEEKYPVQTAAAPTAVEPVVGSAFRGNVFMAPIGGGVEIEPKLALDAKNIKNEENGRVSNVRNNVKIELKENQWWWD
ncbi:MAG: DUF1598 domain-containing protein [Planctomycetaceae bacterium]|nr:DUF1598 domain-containing protein [Planctomycetaceae bacterium]